MNEHEQWIAALKGSLTDVNFVKVTLSKPSGESDLQNVYVKVIELKGEPMLSFTFHGKSKDEVKNHEIEKGVELIDNLIRSDFKIGTLFTTKADLVLRTSKKGKVELVTTKPSFDSVPSTSHDNLKKKRAASTELYLHKLGVTDNAGKVIPRMADKYKQINKYLEIMENLIHSIDLPVPVRVVDMGAGKGYLTFALYDFITNKLRHKAIVTGVEQRKELADECNKISEQVGFDGLSFVCSSIRDFEMGQIDILIALHACDTATDDAIARGIQSNASLIVCAPCCHKQIRQQLKGKELKNPILKYGIFKERELEMVTDTLRALILEKHNYTASIFEFISNEHTRKNVMLVGTKSTHTPDVKAIEKKIENLKEQYQIEYHHLENLI